LTIVGVARNFAGAGADRFQQPNIKAYGL